MEKDINEEIEVNEGYQQVKNRLIAALTHLDQDTDGIDNKIAPLFRAGKRYSNQIEQLADDEILNLLTIYDEDLAKDGFSVSIDKDGYITKVSQRLEKYQNFEVNKHNLKEQLLTNKTKAFNDSGISCKTNEINDILNISKDDIENIKVFDMFDEEEYQKFYKKYLDKYLSMLKEKNDIKMFTEDGHSVKQTLNDFDNYIKDLVSYELNGVEDEPVELPPFGGLNRSDVRARVSYYFEPLGSIKTDRLFHQNNHLDLIKQLSLDDKKKLVATCTEHVQSLVENYKNRINPSQNEKIGLLLNAREYITASEKAFKSYNWLKRLINKDNCKAFRDERVRLIDSISKATDLSVKDCELFFKNTKPNISYKGNVYNYNTLFINSKNFEDNLNGFYKDEAEHKLNINVDIDKDYGANLNTVEANEELKKDKDLNSSR